MSDVVDFIQAMVNDKPVQAAAAFDAAVLSRLDDRLETVRAEVVSGLYNNNSQEETE